MEAPMRTQWNHEGHRLPSCPISRFPNFRNYPNDCNVGLVPNSTTVYWRPVCFESTVTLEQGSYHFDGWNWTGHFTAYFCLCLHWRLHADWWRLLEDLGEFQSNQWLQWLLRQLYDHQCGNGLWQFEKLVVVPLDRPCVVVGGTGLHVDSVICHSVQNVVGLQACTLLTNIANFI